MKARFHEHLEGDFVRCDLCPHHCVIGPGRRGLCRVRENRAGTLTALTYGRVASTAMDPIEKKPLYHFHPGRQILSIGTWGCNLQCLFCQNCEISQGEVPTRELAPEEAVRLAREQDSVGIAYTYNEPLIGWEYVHDTARAARDAGLKNVLVTNGYVEDAPLRELLPLVDAMNIDIKAFHESFYDEVCGGHLEPVLATAERAAAACHVEVTTLVIPGHNDRPREIEALATWIAEHMGRKTPAHLSAYFPAYKLSAEPTRPEMLLRAREIFRQELDFVYLGNLRSADGADTPCPGCGTVVVARSGYAVDTSNMTGEGACAACGAATGIVT
jgi:pyruvate formate lyase activating enzyme